ncbi:MAG TPA: RsmD family RNA methyltransferase [Candidatus Saccharimonadales bacterium]|nr:RsmD family RNA methyltransferase [Candidatus Saccharimonadales bacterium]
MRVIAGTLGGRNFDSPGSHRTHPMSDKMRGALFNILGDVNDLVVLDAFGGSGALSFEAASRGAREVVVLDNDRQAQQTIEQNIRVLGLDGQVQLIKAAAGAWLNTTYDEQFDVVLCDPPYDDLQPALLVRLASRVIPHGVLVLSYPAGMPAPELPRLEQIKQQGYGDAQLIFYRGVAPTDLAIDL